MVRGTVELLARVAVRARVSPAGAGSTVGGELMRAGARVYPRWRGEHCMALASCLRGCLFIPAGAGNTYIRAKNKATATVYPRWRGEHTPAALDLKKGRGLSPLARGTLHGYASSQRRSRFIPAGAGNTPRLFKRGRRGSVYPRWRGEHRLCLRLYRWWRGLSPLARGTLLMVSFL